MPHRHDLLDKVTADWQRTLQVLYAKEVPEPEQAIVAALLVMAARVEALEDTLLTILPEAGRGN